MNGLNFDSKMFESNAFSAITQLKQNVPRGTQETLKLFSD